MASISTTTLRCGTTLIVETIDGVRSAALSWSLPCGHALDPADKLGRAAMWEELLLRGAGALDSRAQADAFDRLGASRGTDPAALSFRISTTALGDRLRDVLPLLVDMVRAPRMEPEAIDAARDLALQALDALRDEPQERAGHLLRQTHMPAPLDRTGLGTADGLAALSRDDLLAGWASAASPTPGVIAAAGQVNAETLEADLNRLLRDWRGSTPEPTIGPTPARGYAHEDDATNQVQVLAALDAPPEPHPDSILEKFAVSVLSGGMSGRLFTEVREKRGLCYSVSAGYRGERDFGTTTAYVGTTPERAQESLDVLWAQLVHATTPEGRVTPAEFAKAKVGMKSALVFSGESTSARAGSLASDFRRLGRARSLDEMSRAIDAVSLDALNDYLARRSLARPSIVTLGPRALRSPV